MRRVLFASVLLGLLVSCNEHTPPPVQSQQQSNAAAPTAVPAPPAAKDTFKMGAVIPQVTLRGNASQSFALYLPAKYSGQAKLPAIIFFDPHGDGTVPLNLYNKLAEKYNYVLIASNSSKNGMGLEQTNAVATSLINEARSRFNIDENRITLCGFSGGAKVALMAGATNPLIATIIYCGAATNINPNHPITLLGFAGTKDMNYTDVVAFEWDLKNTSIPHYLIQWGGKHEFPTSDVFTDAFVFLGTGKIPDYDKKQVTITAPQVEEEQGMKKNLYQGLQTQNIDWWKNVIAQLNTKKKTDPVADRLLGFVSLACYSVCNNMLQQNSLQGMDKILAIYKMADPGNKDYADFYAQYNKKIKAGPTK